MKDAPEIDWYPRFREMEADRDYWRTRARDWKERYDLLTAEKPPEVADLPPQLRHALSQAANGMPADVVRVVTRNVVSTYASTAGEEDVRISAALKRLRDGDSARVAMFLGEGID